MWQETVIRITRSKRATNQVLLQIDLTSQLKKLLLTTVLFFVLVPYSYGAVLNYGNGGRYVGPTVNSEPHGKGKIYWPDGTQYVGEFRQGKWFHGQGTLTLGKDKEHPGHTIVGEWRDGKPWNAINYNADKSIRGSYTNGKWCSGKACNNNVGGSKIWCANKHWAMRTTKTVCKANGGKVFDTQQEAEAEHQRLKGQGEVWCANKLWAMRTTKRICKASGGKEFDTQQEAETEYKRLKRQSTTASSKKVWCVHSGELTHLPTFDCKELTGKGFTLREEAQEYDKLNKKFEVLAGENMALRAVGRELELELSEARQELERLRRKLED